MCAWTNAYSIGIPEIDSQHMELVDIMNRLWDALIRQAEAKEMLSLIESLERYTVAHFCAEETMMRISGYPELNRHKQSHAQFVGKIGEKKMELADGKALQLDLLHYLRDWLVEHILQADKHYADYYESQKKPRGFFSRFFGKLVG